MRHDSLHIPDTYVTDVVCDAVAHLLLGVTRLDVSQNEAGAVDGRPRVVRPHRDFRLILAMDPRHGEVSRAMRNRGVELCLLPEQTDDDTMHETSTQVVVSKALSVIGTAIAVQPSPALPHAQGQHTGLWLRRISWWSQQTLPLVIMTISAYLLRPLRTRAVASQAEDLEGLLTLEGVPGAALPGAMAAAHATAVAASAAIGRPGPTRRELRQWASLARELLQRGWSAREALTVSCQQVGFPRRPHFPRACTTWSLLARMMLKYADVGTLPGNITPVNMIADATVAPTADICARPGVAGRCGRHGARFRLVFRSVGGSAQQRRRAARRRRLAAPDDGGADLL